ncbi:DUF1801 domain-containing protein [Leptolyngbya sp. 7M]|uniref:DUF1801 domain-containing protein n=1 Tax=Leptolyngbya sp. 7M TaxID=2812896 RepID=UPI001B8B4E84|nr:DUF1801 domain-containing protein [Leptolyngbya sp. 7M]QYO66527.1 DUF1801 domain-containing protein [Leptolyngbya sp. 7M]
MAKATTTIKENETNLVSELISGLEHPFKSEIDEMRHLILGLDTLVTEKIKWNAPSFCWNGEDRITFKLQPRNCFQIVFHRGANPSGQGSVTVSDPKGLLKWAAADRAVATIPDAAYFQEHKQALLDISLSWMRPA